VKIADTIHAPKKTSNGYLTTLSGVWAEFVQNDISRPVSYVGKFQFDPSIQKRKDFS
jgi:hypothetical protein